jgi:flagellar biosynthetic protein FliR
MSPLHALAAGLVLVLVRTSALVLSTPVLGQGTGFAGHRVGLIFFLSLLLFVALGTPSADAPPIELALMAMREALIGIFLGYLLQLVLLAMHVAGELVSQEMGFLVARQVDPTSGTSSTLISSLYENLFVLTFLALDGHHWLLRSLKSSFSFAPVGRIALSERMAPTAIAMFGEMFRAGIVFAAPVMVFLMIVSAILGLLARAVPALNVLEIGFTLRVLVALAAIFLFAPLMGPALNTLHQDLLRWLERGLAAI